MATDADDQDFDETLKSFELLTGLSAAPAVTVSAGNPFQIRPASLNAFGSSETAVKQIFGTHCECGAERMMPIPADCTAKPSQPHSSKHHNASLEHGIINPTPFKHKVKGEKKAIVRESMLKNIGRCVHQNLAKQGNSIPKQHGKTVRQRHSSNTFLPVASSSSSAGGGSQLKPSLSENNLTKCFTNEDSDDMLDFRLLVAQCSELTLSQTNKGTSSDFSQSSFKSLRQANLSSFHLRRSTGSSSSSSSSSSHTRRSRRARQLKRCNSASSLESDSSSSSGMQFGLGALGAGSGGTAGPSSANSSSSSQQQQQSPNALSPSSSSSCSTQARLNNVMPCDITIDEMASYFETLVHIPKKMSSMAEMMYI